jgi:type IV pilus assembly protein PilO
MLEKLSRLPWMLQFLVMLAVAGVVWYGFHYFVLSATAAETAQAYERRDALRMQNQQAAVVESRIAEFRARFEQLKIEYEQAKQLLPEAVELSRVLENVQTLARSRLIVRSFVPNDEQQREFYRVRPVKVEVLGTYPALQDFFQQIANLKRVVNVTEAEIKSAQEQRPNISLEASFIVSAFYAEPEDINNLKPLPPRSAAPGPKPGAEASAAPPASQPSPAASSNPPNTTTGTTSNERPVS